ncbi:MAG: alanine racemase [Acidobacteria bacterium]|nr:alanine racemase [Acidobacteriota bacterium]
MMRCWVEISRERLAANFQAIRKAVGESVAVMPVVKADAYRHGAAEVAAVLTAEGAEWLAVSSVDEGLHLRRHGVAARVLIMGGVLPWERPLLKEFELTPAIHDLADIGAIGDIPYHLKVDSGMGRLGVRATPREIVEAVAAHPATLEGLMTHFASSADFSSPQTDLQVETFEAVREALSAGGHSPRYVHMASTNPVMLPRRHTWQNMVRPGIAVYGYWTPGKEAPRPLLEVKPVLAWKASIVLVKEIERGSPLGYGAMYWAQRDMRIAVLGIGYADGLPHKLSNRGRILAGGRPAPILGAVSMDLTTIDITHAPHLKAGDTVTIIGSDGDAQQDARHLARAAGTITYAVLCGISSRVKRVYV